MGVAFLALALTLWNRNKDKKTAVLSRSASLFIKANRLGAHKTAYVSLAVWDGGALVVFSYAWPGHYNHNVGGAFHVFIMNT